MAQGLHAHLAARTGDHTRSTRADMLPERFRTSAKPRSPNMLPQIPSQGPATTARGRVACKHIWQSSLSPSWAKARMAFVRWGASGRPRWSPAARMETQRGATSRRHCRLGQSVSLAQVLKKNSVRAVKSTSLRTEGDQSGRKTCTRLFCSSATTMAKPIPFRTSAAPVGRLELGRTCTHAPVGEVRLAERRDGRASELTGPWQAALVDQSFLVRKGLPHPGQRGHLDALAGVRRGRQQQRIGLLEPGFQRGLHTQPTLHSRAASRLLAAPGDHPQHQDDRSCRSQLWPLGQDGGWQLGEQRGNCS